MRSGEMCVLVLHSRRIDILSGETILLELYLTPSCFSALSAGVQETTLLGETIFSFFRAGTDPIFEGVWCTLRLSLV